MTQPLSNPRGMSTAAWLVGVLAATVIELLLGMALTIMGLQENCGDRVVERWECSDSLRTVFQISFVLVPLIAVGGTALRQRRRGRPLRFVGLAVLLLAAEVGLIKLYDTTASHCCPDPLWRDAILWGWQAVVPLLLLTLGGFRIFRWTRERAGASSRRCTHHPLRHGQP